MTRLLFSVLYTIASASAQSGDGANATDTGLEVWAIGLASGGGASALLLCTYAVTLYRRASARGDDTPTGTQAAQRSTAPPAPASTTATSAGADTGASRTDTTIDMTNVAQDIPNPSEIVSAAKMVAGRAGSAVANAGKTVATTAATAAGAATAATAATAAGTANKVTSALGGSTAPTLRVGQTKPFPSAWGPPPAPDGSAVAYELPLGYGKGDAALAQWARKKMYERRS